LDLRRLFSVESIQLIMDCLPERDPLFDLLIEIFASHWDPPYAHEHENNDLDPKRDYEFPKFWKLVAECQLIARRQQKSSYQGTARCHCLNIAARLTVRTVKPDIDEGLYGGFWVDGDYSHSC